jgi:hypothetical protein
MRAIELESTVDHHTIPLPETIPDGTHLRVLLLMDDPHRPANDGGDLQGLLAGLTEGLTAEDLQRARDFGRGDPERAS